MRVLIGVVLAAALAWGGYWFVGSRAMQRGAEAWFAEQADHGLVATRDALSVQGFPSRFDLTVRNIHLADPASGYGWTAPFVQVLTLSYTPWHWIVALPPEQSVQLPLETLTLASGKLQGSLVVQPTPELTLDRIAVVGDALRLTSTAGWSVDADTLRFATRLVDGDGARHEVGIDLLGVSPDPRLLANLPDLPATLDRLHLDADLRFSAPLDRHAETSHPHLAALTLKDLSASWGSIALSGNGSLDRDAAGFADGRITLRLTNWRQLLAVAVASGLVAPEVAPTWENVLTLLARQSGDAATLDLPISFGNGRMSIGPLPLGAAPRFD